MSQKSITDQELPLHSENPYTNSTILHHLKQRQQHNLPLRIAFFDIDSTMTTNKPEVSQQVRKRLETEGYVIVFVTSRTEESIISQEEYQHSPKLSRPEPHLAQDESGKYIYIDPGDFIDLKGTIDPDGICGTTGTTIYIQQADGGYEPDVHYLRLMKSDPLMWRTAVYKLLDTIYNQFPFFTLQSIEYVSNYHNGLTNVFPPDHRIQIQFDDLDIKYKFADIVKEVTQQMKQTLPLSEYELLRELRVTDDSNPNKQRYSVYLTPHAGYKAKAVHQIVTQVAEYMDLQLSDFELLIAGDSFPDLAMGLYGGLGAEVIFLLAGGSRLTPHLLQEEPPDFVGEELRSIVKQLEATGEKGHFAFNIPGHKTREVVFLDEIFPDKVGPESILEFLKTDN